MDRLFEGEIDLLSAQLLKSREGLHQRLDEALDALARVQADRGLLRPGDRIHYYSGENEKQIWLALQDITCALTGEHWKVIQKG